MGLAIAVYFLPDLSGLLGLRSETFAMANTAILGIGVAAYLGAWLVGHLAISQAAATLNQSICQC